MRGSSHMLTSKLKKFTTPTMTTTPYYDYYTIPIGIAQLNAFSCAKNVRGSTAYWQDQMYDVLAML